MSEPVIIAFRPEYLSLPDAEGKPLGTDATLFLSQIAWLSTNRADERGWVEWTISDCERVTGLSPDKQQRICARLEAAGYLKRDRKGVDGKRVLRADTAKCGNGIPQNAATETENEKGYRKMRIPQNADTAKCGNGIPQNTATEPLPVSTKESKTLKESPPYISPKKGEPRQARTVFVPPSLEEVAAYLAEIGVPHLAEQWLAYYQANGWKIGRNPMKDWKASCRTWKANERANVRGSPARAAPVASNRTMADLAAEEGEALRRIFEKRGGVQNGR